MAKFFTISYRKQSFSTQSAVICRTLRPQTKMGNPQKGNARGRVLVLFGAIP